MRFSETYKPIPVIEADDYGSAGIDGDSVNMALLHSVALFIHFGDLTGNSILKLYSGAAPATKTTALAFQYRLGDAVYKGIGADNLGDLTDVAATGLSLVAATFDHKLVVIEVRSAEMPAAEEWLTAEIDATATLLNVACVGLGHPRYAAHDGPSVLDPA